MGPESKPKYSVLEQPGIPKPSTVLEQSGNLKPPTVWNSLEPKTSYCFGQSGNLNFILFRTVWKPKFHTV